MSVPPSILPLDVDAVSYAANGRVLVDGVSFRLPSGGVTAVVGPNGAGKSLLLRLIHGLLAPSTGAVRWSVAGGQIDGRRRHAMVFQHPVMLRRSVHANMTHAIKSVGLADVRERAMSALARFGLSALADRPARQLSGGERQRLAIARAWALEAEVMLLDEPTSQLDPSATRQIEQVITALAADGMTLVMTTHDLGQARRLARRILFLDRGRLIEDADAQAFFNAPRAARSRAFIDGELLW